MEPHSLGKPNVDSSAYYSVHKDANKLRQSTHVLRFRFYYTENLASVERKQVALISVGRP